MAPIEKLAELCPDRKLLDPEFGGYKLSLSPVPVHKKEIKGLGIDVVEPSDEQFSYLHQKEFNLHNHLYGDIWNPGSVYFIDKNKKLMMVSMTNNSFQLDDPQEIWEISDMKPRLSGDYNASLCFASSDIAVLSDGAGSIYILETSCREKPTPWKLLHSQKILDEKRGFTVVDSRSVNESPNRVVWCVLRNIVHCEKTDAVNKDKKVPRYEAFIQAVNFIEERGSWKMGEVKKICNAPSVEYSVLDPDCKGIYIAGDIPMPVIHQHPDKDDDKLPEYYWQQNFEDIKIWFDTSEGTEKSDISVETKDTELKVSVKGNVILEGKLFQRIDSSLTTWSFNPGRLEMVVQKSEAGGMWKCVIEGNEAGKEVVDKAVVEEIHNKLSHLCSDKQEEGSTTMFNSSQLEECDAFDEEARTLARFDLDTLQPTLKVMLGGQQWMMGVEGEAGRAGGFCLRFDVDGCVWAPQGDPPTFHHLGTFLAFGYVEASKTNKKFVVTPPDLSYIAIIDVTNHVMIYRKGIAVKGSLRNRKTGQQVSELATQQLVNLQSPAQLLGAIARPEALYVLTTDHIYALIVSGE